MLTTKKSTHKKKIKTPFKQQLYRLFKLCIFLSLLFAVSFITPLFSKVGLLFLQNLPIPQANSQPHHGITSTPTAYVLLGGGLTKDKNNPKDEDNQPNIIINEFTEQRLQTLLSHYQNQPLPIILSGVESPWMQDWLIEHGINSDDITTENASMNTCENARFTAKRASLQNVYLITDEYHMSRARRQFALNGIITTPLPAPLPSPTKWWQFHANARHSRRTLYEIGAYLRDVIKPQDDCRQADEVSIETLKQSRKPDDIRTF